MHFAIGIAEKHSQFETISMGYAQMELHDRPGYKVTVSMMSVPAIAFAVIRAHVWWWVNAASFPWCRGACPEDYPDVMCRENTSLARHDPPLLYDLFSDPGELNELDPDEYADVLAMIDTV